MDMSIQFWNHENVEGHFEGVLHRVRSTYVVLEVSSQKEMDLARISEPLHS